MPEVEVEPPPEEHASATADLSGLFAPEVRKLTAALGLSTTLVAFEGLSVVAALPELGRDLTGPATVQFLPLVMTVYLLASGVAIAVAGPFADGFGPRRVYRTGLLIFGVASLGCGFATHLWLLVPLRLVQGAAGGMLIACSGASVGLGYPLRLRARAYALASTIWGVLGVGGPAIAAALLTVLSWRWIFWVNVPLAALALLVGWRAIPGPARGAQPQATDRVGILLLIGLVSTAVFGLSEVSPRSLLALAVTAGLALWFHRRAGLRGADQPPVLRRRHYASDPFRSLALAAALAVGAGVGVENYLPLYLREVRGASVGLASASVLFLTIGWTLAANTVSRLYDRISEARCALIGTASLPLTIAVAGIAVWQDLPLTVLFGAYFAVGLGIGATTNACLTLTQAAAQDTEIGRATSAHQFMRNMALTYGTAAMGTLTLLFEPMLGSGVAGSPAAEALRDGYVIAHALALALALVASLAARRVASVVPTAEPQS